MTKEAAETSKLRFLHLIASNFVGGPEKQILRHLRDLSAAGHDVWVGSFRDLSSRPEILEAAEGLGIQTLELSSGHVFPLTALQLARWVRRNNLSLLCTHGYKANAIGWLTTRLAAVPHVCFVRGWTAETPRVKFYERLERLVLARSPWVVTVSRALADQVQVRRAKQQVPVVVPNAALFLAHDAGLHIDRLELRRSLGLGEEYFWVCAAGRLSAEKGQRFLVDALPSLAAAIPNLRVAILGEGREREALASQAAQLGIQDRVVLAGFQKQVQRWIQGCDVVVNPSLTEGTPNIVLEAMALGTPVIATAVGGVPDLVQDGESGLLVPAGDSVAISHAVLSLWADPTLSRRLARNAQIRVRDFSPEKQTRLLLDLYSRVLRSPQGEGHSNQTISRTQQEADSPAQAGVAD